MKKTGTTTHAYAGVLRRSALATAVALALAAGILPERTVAQGSPVASSADFRPELAAARAATDRRDWTEALARWKALEKAAPSDVDLLIESARVHGFADRNAEAAERYRKVIDLAPARRADVLFSLAWQTLWTGEPKRAEPLFLEVAAQPAAFAGGGDGFDAWRGVAECRRDEGRLDDALQALERAQSLRPNDRGTARRIAQTLAWQDRHDEAIAAYTTLMQSDPTDWESAYGLARARNFAGRHREAVADYRAALAADRAGGRKPRTDVLFDQGRALRWAGYDDFAQQSLQALADPEAQWLRDFRVGRELRHWADGGIEFSTDSDKLDTRIVSGTFGWRITSSSSLDVGLRWVDLTQPAISATGERLGVTWRTRLGAGIDAIGSPSDPGPAWISATLQANRYDDWRPVTGAARLRWLPADSLRLEGELGREVVETPQAISNQVTVDIASIGSEWRWHPRSSVYASISALDFSDNNLRTRLNLRADYVLNARPRVVAGVEGMAFRSSDPTSDTQPYLGYWNPRAYREARGFLTVSHEARPWDFAAKLGIGISREEDGWGNRSSGNPNLIELSAACDIDKSIRVRAYAGGSGGSMGIASGGEGYWRRFVGIGVTGWF